MSIAILGKKLALTMQAVAIAFGFSAFSLAAVTVSATPAHAAVCQPDTFNLQNGADCSQAAGTKDNLFGSNGIFQTIANTLIFLVGAIAVLFLIIGGLRYVISNGEAKNVEAAKNTILYAIVGIVVAILSYAAVNFVINALSKSA